MGDSTRETGLSQVRHNIPSNEVHKSEPSFGQHSVENQKTEGKSLLSYLTSPVETIINIYDRLVHTEEELSLRDEAQRLSDPNISEEEKNTILDKLTGKVDGPSKRAVTFAALSVISNSNVAQGDRLALVQSLGAEESNFKNKEFGEALCLLISEGVDADKIRDLVISYTESGSPKERSNNCRSMIDALSACPANQRDIGLVHQVCDSFVAANPNKSMKEDSLVSVFRLYEDIISNEENSFEVRHQAMQKMLGTINPKDPAFTPLSGYTQRNYVDSVLVQVSALMDTSDANGQEQCIKTLISTDGLSGKVYEALNRYSPVDQPVPIAAKNHLLEHLQIFVQKNPELACEHKIDVQHLIKALADPASAKRTIELASFYKEMALQPSISLKDRMEFQMKACAIVASAQKSGKELPEDLVMFANTTPVLAECKIALTDKNQSFDKHHDAFLALKHYKGAFTAIHGSRKDPFEGLRSWENYESLFTEYALQDGNASKVSPSLLLNLCAKDPDLLLQLASNKDAAKNMDVKEVLARAQPHGREAFQAVGYALAVNDSLSIEERVYAIKYGLKRDDIARESACTKLLELAQDESISIKTATLMQIAGELKSQKLKDEATGIYLRMALDSELDINDRVEAFVRGNLNDNKEIRQAVSRTLCTEILKNNLENVSDASEAMLRYNFLVKHNLLSKEDRQQLETHLAAKAAESEDPRISDLFSLTFYQGERISPKRIQDALDSFKEIVNDPSLSKDQKFILAYVPMRQLVDSKRLYNNQGALNDYLDFAASLFSDPSELSYSLLSKNVLIDARESMTNAARAVGMNPDDPRLNTIQDLHHYTTMSHLPPLIERRARPVYHAPEAVTFETEDVDPIKVRWSAAYIGKFLPKPRIPDVSHQDFQTWAAQFQTELQGNQAAQDQLKAMADCKLSALMDASKRDEFSEFLQQSKVEGAFVDPIALSLRRIVEHGQSLSDQATPPDIISPRAQLFQQLVVNCMTCQTGFKDGIELTARHLPASIESEDSDTDIHLSEEEMRTQRSKNELAAEYWDTSVKRRKALLEGNSNFTKDILGQSHDKKVKESPHQSWAMDAILGKRTGLHTEGERFWVDTYTYGMGRTVASSTIYTTDPQDAIDEFYEHYDLKTEVAYFKELWNSQIEADNKRSEDLSNAQEKQVRLNALNRKEASENGLTEEEVAEKEELESMNLQEEIDRLKAIKPYGTNDKVTAALSGQDMFNAFDWDEDFMNPEGLNDYGVILLFKTLGVVEEAS